MQDFNERHSCPKCGNPLINTVHRSGCGEPWSDGDYLQRECGRCRYMWNERPLDAQSKKESSE